MDDPYIGQTIILDGHSRVCTGYEPETQESVWEAAPTEWQPIESAPRDGTTVDLWTATSFTDGCEGYGNRITDARWGRVDGMECWGEFSDALSEYFAIEVEWNTGQTVVTHWLPLPEPPK